MSNDIYCLFRCDGVPDGEAVQIGGRSSASPKYWNHQSPNACVAASWARVDYTDVEGKDQLFETAAPTIAPTPVPTLNFTFMPTPMTTAPTPAPTKQCLDDDVGIKKDQGMSNCSEVAEFCADLTYGPMVQNYCPKTCGKCTEIDEALADMMMDPGGDINGVFLWPIIVVCSNLVRLICTASHAMSSLMPTHMLNLVILHEKTKVPNLLCNHMSNHMSNHILPSSHPCA